MLPPGYWANAAPAMTSPHAAAMATTVKPFAKRRIRTVIPPIPDLDDWKIPWPFLLNQRLEHKSRLGLHPISWIGTFAGAEPNALVCSF